MEAGFSSGAVPGRVEETGTGVGDAALRGSQITLLKFLPSLAAVRISIIWP
jgi:hypothetical protein